MRFIVSLKFRTGKWYLETREYGTKQVYVMGLFLDPGAAQVCIEQVLQNLQQSKYFIQVAASGKAGEIAVDFEYSDRSVDRLPWLK